MWRLKKAILILGLLAAVFCLLSSPALAHKVRIFAYAEGNTIIGETAFSGGGAPRESEIIVQNAANSETLHTCRTDEQGYFSFSIPSHARRDHLDLRIIINVGEGHRGEWLLKAEEYLGDGESNSANKEETVTVTAPASMPPEPLFIDEARIRQLVEETLDKKLGPIKRMVAEGRNQGTSMQDILGGIGYILGLVGIIAYFKSKQKKE